MRLRPDIGIVAITRLHRLSTASSANAGESRGRVEVAVGPEVRLHARHDITFRVAPPVSYSKAWIDTVPGRAVRGAYEGGHGYVVGAVTASELWVNQFGGYLGLSYAARVNWFDYHTELIAPPHARATERHRFRPRSRGAAVSSGRAWGPAPSSPLPQAVGAIALMSLGGRDVFVGGVP